MTTIDRADFEKRLAQLEALSRAGLGQVGQAGSKDAVAALTVHYRARIEAFQDVHRILRNMEEDAEVQRSIQDVVMKGIDTLVTVRGAHA